MATILIIDDDLATILELKRVLKQHTLLCAQTVKNGRALFKMHQRSIDIILLDGYMSKDDPTPTTLDLPTEMRRKSFMGPIIAMSSDLEMRRDQIKNGCSSEATKLLPESLAAYIDQLLRGGAGTGR